MASRNLIKSSTSSLLKLAATRNNNTIRRINVRAFTTSYSLSGSSLQESRLALNRPDTSTTKASQASNFSTTSKKMASDHPGEKTGPDTEGVHNLLRYVLLRSPLSHTHVSNHDRSSQLNLQESSD